MGRQTSTLRGRVPEKAVVVTNNRLLEAEWTMSTPDGRYRGRLSTTVELTPRSISRRPVTR